MRPRPEETPEAAAERKAKKVALLMSGVRCDGAGARLQLTRSVQVMPVRPHAAKWVAKGDDQ